MKTKLKYKDILSDAKELARLSDLPFMIYKNAGRFGMVLLKNIMDLPLQARFVCYVYVDGVVEKINRRNAKSG